MGKRAPYLSGYFLLDRGDGSGSGTEDCPRAQGLFLLFLGEALEKKNGLDLVSRDGPNPFLEKSLKESEETGSK